MAKRCLFCALAIFFLQGAPGFAQNSEMDAASPFLPPEYSKKISMDFKDAPLDTVLKIFSQQSNFNLISSESISGKKVTVFLDNVPLDQALEQLLRANNLTFEVQPDSNIYIVKPLPQLEMELITRVYNLKNASVSSASIQKTIKVEGVDISQTAGITETLKSLLTTKGKIIEDPRTNSLVISDIASNFPKIENALAKLDVPVPQILIEVEMLEVTKDIIDKIGNDMSGDYVSITASKKLNLFPFTLPAEYEWAAGPYYAGSVDFSGLTSALQFLHKQTDTKTLARPRILTLNNQAAEIKITTQQAVGNIQTNSGSGATETKTSSAERVETGISLVVTPQANLLTGEIIMAVYPKAAAVKNDTTIGATTYYNPEKRESKTLLRVQNGDTVIIGGLLRQDVQKVVNKVPVFGDIPFIGAAFRFRSETVTDRELIIFITPHIINESPLPQITAANIRKLDREQDVPADIEKKPLTSPTANN